MPICVHLTSEKNAKQILRTGIKAVANGVNGQKGIYCMPILQNFYASHQWLRELKRGSARRGSTAMVTIRFFAWPQMRLFLLGTIQRRTSK